MMRAALIAFLIIMASVSAYLTYDAYSFLAVAPESPGGEKVFTIAPGSSFDSVAAELEKQGFVRDLKRFRLLGRVTGAGKKIRAGEFLLHTGWPPLRLLKELTTATSVLHRLSVREGLTWWQTAALVEAAGLGSKNSFAEALRNQKLLAKYGIPGETAEGYLFPETYFLSRPHDNDATAVVEEMLAMFREAAGEVWPNGLPDPAALRETVILASLVEKETGDPSERARIAGVYANRLKKGMLLQCDPTVIYGLGLKFDGNITKKHLLDKANPYNTYRHRGLPPGPICSPGREALRAAVTPEQHSYLYFVSKKDGTHYFSKSLEEHNRAVAKYQLHRR